MSLQKSNSKKDKRFLWELPQNLSLSVKQCGNYHKSRFYEPILKLWELILLEKFFLSRTHVKIGFKF
ncbi:hypothetical protein LEP1GSC158_2766 [Leptospira interrogans serovar Zanoni str. LT2156]|uniref:Uncharacterized protein n=1 Tax=Leptospira interrogans serovar Zanoni str. LT2156 TaxID=1001601 RepID=M6HIU3_LEPIR|nr:hypothetical protein LEP1GSC158_2766 [Leptospira interrogans serovar Zanoni str. LT2156]